MRIRPYSEQLSIVLLGQFNPAIFQPAWFAAHGLVGEREAEKARINVIHPEITQIGLAEMDLSVGRGRFSVQTSSPHPEIISDFVIQIFGTYLIHTPISALGINRAVHFDCGTFDVRNSVGISLAPHEPWGSWGSRLRGEPTDPATVGGLASLTMKEARYAAPFAGFVQARIEPSMHRPFTGIFMEINDHYELPVVPQEISGARQMVDTLETQWKYSLTNAASIIDQIMTLAEGFQRR